MDVTGEGVCPIRHSPNFLKHQQHTIYNNMSPSPVRLGLGLALGLRLLLGLGGDRAASTRGECNYTTIVVYIHVLRLYYLYIAASSKKTLFLGPEEEL